MSNVKCCTPNAGYMCSDLTERMICAAAAGKDSCQGDSGGRAMNKFIFKVTVHYFRKIGGRP